MREGDAGQSRIRYGTRADLPLTVCIRPRACWRKPDGGIFDANVAFSQMLGYEDRELMGNTIYMHAAPADIAPLMAQVCDLITGKVVRSRRAMRLQHKNGSVLGCTLDMSGERTAPDKMYIIVYAFQDNVDYCQQPHPQHIALDRLSLNDSPSAMGAVANHARPAVHGIAALAGAAHGNVGAAPFSRWQQPMQAQVESAGAGDQGNVNVLDGLRPGGAAGAGGFADRAGGQFSVDGVGGGGLGGGAVAGGGGG